MAYIFDFIWGFSCDRQLLVEQMSVITHHETSWMAQVDFLGKTYENNDWSNETGVIHQGLASFIGLV